MFVDGFSWIAAGINCNWVED